MIFQGDTTYFVDGEADFDDVILEGGSVIKYPNDTTAFIEVDGNLTCDTQPYLPCTFTAADDDSIGQSMSGIWTDYTGTIQPGGYANLALDVETSEETISLSCLRFCDAVIAFNNGGGEPYIGATNIQVINCGLGFHFGSLYIPPIATIENVLITNSSAAFAGTCESIAIENATIVNCAVLLSDNYDDSGTSLEIYNTILANVTNLVINTGFDTVSGNNDGFYNSDSTIFGSQVLQGITTNEWPFQTVGGGGCYLTTNCVFHGAGTTNIDPALLADLAQCTTYPPIVYDQITISTNLILGPSVLRDTNSSPDLGYHYPCLDYAFGGCDLYSNLTFTTGTAVGWFEDYGNDSGQPYSISLNSGAKLSFGGNATQPDIYARYVMVQEGENGNWTGNGWMGGLDLDGGSLSADFTKFTSDGWDGNTFRDDFGGRAEFQNCEFYNLADSTYDMSSLDFTNCLFFRGLQTYWYSPNLTFENCTFYNGMLFLGRPNPVNWLIENCSFDGTALTADDDYNEPQYNFIGYNAYNTNNFNWQTYPIYGPFTNTLEVVGSDDLLVNGYNWISSLFGDFYLPTGSQLIYAGNTNANLLGLYHYATTTNLVDGQEVPDGTNIVTIGYHYIASTANGFPLDSNGDGIPDYLEDANGNGIYDAGDLGAWNVVPDYTIPSAWYLSFGLNPNDPSVEVQDPDLDGLLNQQEYQYGTDPQVSEGFGIWVSTPNGTSGIP